MVGSDQNVEPWDGKKLLNGKIAGIGEEAQCLLIDDQGLARTSSRQISDIGVAIQWMCEILQDPQQPYAYWKDIEAVGHRVVHGGEAFTQAVRIDDKVLDQIEQLNDLAPLHNPFSVAGIRTMKQALGESMPMVAVFDTAFHDTLPEHARTYALPLDFAKKKQEFDDMGSMASLMRRWRKAMPDDGTSPSAITPDHAAIRPWVFHVRDCTRTVR